MRQSYTVPRPGVCSLGAAALPGKYSGGNGLPGLSLCSYQTTSCHPQPREDGTTGDTMNPRSQEIPDIEHVSSKQNK